MAITETTEKVLEALKRSREVKKLVGRSATDPVCLALLTLADVLACEACARTDGEDCAAHGRMKDAVQEWAKAHR